jgi:ATP-dependent Clp protease ATP-binding subunit ClpC
MRRAVERYLEDPLAEALLRGDIKAGDIVQVIRRDNSDDLLFQPKVAPAPALTTEETQPEE